MTCLGGICIVGLVAPASAAAADEFSGRCVGSGPVTADKPLTVVPQISGLVFKSRGTCTGTLNGEAVRNARFKGRASSEAGLLSCEAGAASGPVRIVFRDEPGRPVLKGWVDDLNALNVSGFIIRGAEGGMAIGQHQLTPDVPLLTACLGAGITEVGNTLSFGTIEALRG